MTPPTPTREPGAPRLGDLDRKAEASAIAARWAERTQTRQAGRDGACDPALRSHYAQTTRIAGARIASTTDGVGTKVEIAERTRIYDTLAFDLVAMVVDDLAAAGASPVALTNVLDVDRIDVPTVDALMRGLAGAAVAADVAVTGGEIAELGSRVGGFGEGMHFNWCATAIGHYPEGREPLTGANVRPGDALVALESPGFRSNGFSLLRGTLQRAFGDDWHDAPGPGATWGELALLPSVIYAPLVESLLAAGVALTGAAHVTGGGVPNKLGRVLRATGLGAHLTSPCEPPPYVLEAQRLGDIDDASAYRAWNMGQGFLLVVRPEAVGDALAACAARGIVGREAGVVDDSGAIRIESRGLHGGRLTFPTPARAADAGGPP
ncbi:MAG TPA: AIR synthase-related protein [Polyangiaceae bacterium]|nr:AIR synthase-related protein [Polyangiaceae bacterium]